MYTFLRIYSLMILCCIVFHSSNTANAQSDTIRLTITQGWNLISLPLIVPDGRTATLFPSAISRAYSYQSGYTRQDTLQSGVGYWLKFAAAETVQIVGTLVNSDTMPLQSGWNMIGSLGVPIDTSEVSTNPANIIRSGYYHFNEMNGYEIADTLSPGRGYWVKVSQVGTLYQSCRAYSSPTLVSPSDSTGLLNPPILRWKRILCAKNYYLQVAADSAFVQRSIDTTLNDTTYRLASLCDTSRQFWKIGVLSPSHDTIWSALRSFHWVYREEGLLTPPQNDEVLSSPTMGWRSSSCATFYHLQVGTDSLLTNLVKDTALIDTAYRFVMNCIDTSYFWRVGIVSTGGSRMWSTVKSFRWVYQDKTLITPADNGGTTLTPVMKWRRTDCTSSYHLQLARDSLFTQLVIDSILTDTMYQSGQLDSAQMYYWRVGITPPSAPMLWTQTRKFIAAWRYLGLRGEGITALATDWIDPNTIYVASSPVYGGWGSVFKTTNGGATWDTLVSGVTAEDIDINPQNSNIVYATLAENGCRGREHIIKTTDAGATWFRADSGISEGVECVGPLVLAIDPQHPETLYTGNASSIDISYLDKSTNGGMSWFYTGIDQILSIAIDPIRTNVVYVGNGYGDILKTMNGGATWQIITGWGERRWIYDIAVNPVHSDTLYVGTSGSGLYLSTNGGQTWSHSDSGLDGSTTSSVLRITIDRNSPEKQYAYGTGGIYKRIGNSPWEKIGDPTVPGIGLVVSSNGTLYTGGHLYYGGNKGVYKYLR